MRSSLTTIFWRLILIQSISLKQKLNHFLLSGGEDQDDTNSFKSFLNMVKDGQWYCFDLRPLKKSILQNTLELDDVYLSRVIKGYDYLIYIPQLTKSNEISKE